MIATVISVQQNVPKVSKAGKSYTVTEFTYQSDPVPGYPPKQPTTRSVFSNAPQHSTIVGLQAGDRVKMTFLQDAFKSIDTVEKISGVGSPQTTQPRTAPAPYVKDVSKDEAISRAVALKAAVELASAMMTSGYGKLKKTMETPLYVDEIVAMSKLFEPYLMDKEAAVDTTEVDSEQQDFDDQIPFD